MQPVDVARLILSGMGASTAPQTVAALETWFRAEGGAGPQWGIHGNSANYNPLNLTLTYGSRGYGYDPGSGAFYPGARPTPGNNPPVASLVSWPQGIQATIGRLSQGFASSIRRALTDGANCQGLSAAVANSAWGTGGFAGLCGQIPSPPPGPAPLPPAPIPPPPIGISMLTISPATGALWIAGPDGGVFGFDGADYFGSLPGLGIHPSAPIVGIASTMSGRGYWLCGADGGVFCFGDAPFLGSLPEHPQWGAGNILDPCVGIAPWKGDSTPQHGLGYTIGCQVPNKVPNRYEFPGDGTLRGAVVAVRHEVVDAVDKVSHFVLLDERFVLP